MLGASGLPTIALEDNIFKGFGWRIVRPLKDVARPQSVLATVSLVLNQIITARVSEGESAGSCRQRKKTRYVPESERAGISQLTN